jgi:predicted glycosyltransferase
MVDIGHPGHVHFFKNFIWEMKKKGHDILVTASDKDVTLKLLDSYKVDYTVTCKRYSGFMLGYELLRRDIQLFNIARKFKPDYLMGINNTICAHVSKISKGTSLIFTDTEHAKLANAITFPFSDVICTPSCYLHDIGPKQVRYNGYHELAYLHPDRFTPNPDILREMGLSPVDPFIIMRFVSWQASHDVGQHGIRDKIRLVRELERYGRVCITSEKMLPPRLQQYQLKVSPEKLHDLLYYASLYVGEGATTASECAVIGTPAIYANTLSLGYIAEEDDRYHLLIDLSRRPYDDEIVISEARRLLEDSSLKQTCRENRDRMLADKCDVTSFMVQMVEDLKKSPRR